MHCVKYVILCQNSNKNPNLHDIPYSLGLPHLTTYIKDSVTVKCPKLQLKMFKCNFPEEKRGIETTVDMISFYL